MAGRSARKHRDPIVVALVMGLREIAEKRAAEQDDRRSRMRVMDGQRAQDGWIRRRPTSELGRLTDGWHLQEGAATSPAFAPGIVVAHCGSAIADPADVERWSELVPPPTDRRCPFCHAAWRRGEAA